MKKTFLASLAGISLQAMQPPPSGPLDIPGGRVQSLYSHSPVQAAALLDQLSKNSHDLIPAIAESIKREAIAHYQEAIKEGRKPGTEPVANYLKAQLTLLKNEKRAILKKKTWDKDQENQEQCGVDLMLLKMQICSLETALTINCGIDYFTSPSK